MLNVPCGVSGRVRVVLENSISGEITHDVEFANLWTDYGLSTLSVPSSVFAPWPSRLHYGSGAHAAPHASVTSLKNWVGHGTVSYTSGQGVLYDSTLCTVTRTQSVTQAARGVAWNLSEIGLSDQSNNTLLRTYALVKNAAGAVEPVAVSAIEIVTIYYTVQVQYPMSLPPVTVDVEGLPPTTATFTLMPQQPNFAGDCIGARSAARFLSGFSSTSFGGRVPSTDRDSTKDRWSTKSLNGTTKYFGNYDWTASHIWELDPPIVKNNTQELELEIRWTFTNATPIEIP